MEVCGILCCMSDHGCCLSPERSRSAPDRIESAHVTSRHSPIATVAPPLLAPQLNQSSSHIPPPVQQLCTLTTLSFHHDDIFRLHKRACEPVLGVLDRHRCSLRDNHRYKILLTHFGRSAYLDIWPILAVLDMAGRSRLSCVIGPNSRFKEWWWDVVIEAKANTRADMLHKLDRGLIWRHYILPITRH